jgi:hypothetical protein
VHLLISIFTVGVKRGGGRPRSQQEGPARAAGAHMTQQRAREEPVDPQGQPVGWAAPLFFAPLGSLPSDAFVAAGGAAGSVASTALTLRIDGPSSSRR